jgi:hypothetical protein
MSVVERDGLPVREFLWGRDRPQGLARDDQGSGRA